LRFNFAKTKEMQVLIKSAKIVLPGNTLNGSTQDILINNGIIVSVEPKIQVERTVDEVIEGSNLHIAPGFFDFRSRLGEPGFEYRETFESYTNAARAGGFTGAQIMPSTEPKVSTAPILKDLINRGSKFPFNFLFAGTLSNDKLGKQMASLFDMHACGASSFSDDKQPIENSNLMLKALLYASNFNGLVISFPLDVQMADGAQVNESPFTTTLGLRGIPNIAESVAVNRDLLLAEHTKAKLHFAGISTKEAVNKLAEKQTNEVSADVSIINLAFTDNDLNNFDSNLKVMPPLRTNEDKEELITALKKGIIKIVTSDHTPLGIEEKDLEFEYAKFGAATIESTFNVLLQNLGDENLELLVNLLSVEPRKRLGLEIPKLEANEKADLVLFDPHGSTHKTKNDFKTLGYNNPFVNKELPGKILGSILGDSIYLD
jgi:dihydroorotase